MRLLWALVVAGLIVSLVVDLAIGASRPVFYGAYGFVGCIVIIVGSKWLGGLLQRREDYYEQGQPGESADG